MKYELLLIEHITGKLYYTFSHWPIKNNCYLCTIDKPDHTTQVLESIPVNECKILQKEEYND